MKLPGFARTRPLLVSRTILSNLLNKIQFTFEVVPCFYFFEGKHQFQTRVTRELVGGRGVGWGGVVGGDYSSLGEDTRS